MVKTNRMTQSSTFYMRWLFLTFQSIGQLKLNKQLAVTSIDLILTLRNGNVVERVLVVAFKWLILLQIDYDLRTQINGFWFNSSNIFTSTLFKSRLFVPLSEISCKKKQQSVKWNETKSFFFLFFKQALSGQKVID